MPSGRQLADDSSIVTFNDFQDCCARDDGLIVISGSQGAVAHRSGCRYIADEHFVTKVIRNAGQQGGYWWFSHPDTASAAFTALRMCSHCVTATYLQRFQRLP